MLPFCTLNGSTILHIQDAPLRWWCEDIVWTNLRMNYISFTHTLFCVCADSGMSRCSLASTLSWVSLRQPASEKCFYFPTEKFQLSKQNDKKLYPAHESRGRNGPTKWCRWMATILRRVNASDFPSSGVRCAGHLHWISKASSAKDTMLFEIGKTRFSSNIEFTLNSVKTNPTFWIQSPKPNLFFLFILFVHSFSDSDLMIQTIPCVRDAPLRWWRVDSVCADVGNVSFSSSAYSLFAHWMVQQSSISKTRHCADGVKTLCEQTWEWTASAWHTLFFAFVPTQAWVAAF